MRKLAPMFTAPLAAGIGATAPATATADFVDRSGAPIGGARLTEVAEGVVLHVGRRGLIAGPHGSHRRESGACRTPDLASAGGHRAGGRAHGFAGADGPHPGALSNPFVEADGGLRREGDRARVSFDGGPAPLFDDDGAASIGHAGADDHRSRAAGAGIAHG